MTEYERLLSRHVRDDVRPREQSSIIGWKKNNARGEVSHPEYFEKFHQEIDSFESSDKIVLY